MALEKTEHNKIKHVVAEHWSHGENMTGAVDSMLDLLKVDEPGITRQKRLERASRVDHFHGGSIQTTETLRGLMNISRATDLRGVDIGSGIGGPMRWFALQTGAKIDGIDITPEFVEISNRISNRFGMQDQCVARIGDAASLPLAPSTYDFATMMALSCNVPDRRKLYQSTTSVLKPEGIVGMLDIIKGSTEGLVLPVPWSRDGSEATSLLLTTEDTIREAAIAGLQHRETKNVSTEVLAWFENESKEISVGRNVGFEKFMPDWETMVESQVQNLRNGHIRFECLVFQKTA